MDDMDENLEAGAPKKGKPSRKKIPFAVKIVAKTLTETGMTQKEAAAELGISEDTIHRAISDPSLDRQIVEKAKFQLPVKMYNIAMKIADRLDQHPEILAKMNPYMCSLVLAIMIDKSRLMQGQSTEALEVQSKILQIQGALDSIDSLRKKLGVPPATPEN